MVKKTNKIKYSKRMKGGGKISKYDYNGKDIILVGVKHDQRGLSMDEISKLVDLNNQKQFCYLIEYDKRFNKQQTKDIQKHGEYTTKFIMEALMKEFKDTYFNQCIRGWDIRQTILGQKNQNILYSNQIYTAPLGFIIENYIKKLPSTIPSVDINKYFDKKVAEYINQMYKNEMTYHFLRPNKQSNNESLMDWLMYNLPKAMAAYNDQRNMMSLSLGDISKMLPIEHLHKLVFTIRDSFAKISDLVLLDQILTNKINYIVFMGEMHYNNVQNHLKNLGIN